ncbi:MAG: hypothetical protein AAF509_01615, partial [Pseudomonadota bacterium]
MPPKVTCPDAGKSSRVSTCAKARRSSSLGAVIPTTLPAAKAAVISSSTMFPSASCTLTAR